MKKIIGQIGIYALLALGLVGCYTVPETGRSTVNFFPESFLNNQASLAFDSMKQKSPVSTDTQVNNRVRSVGRRIVEAIGDQKHLPPVDQWEFVVFDEPDTINAFAMPGGKVGVYTGLLNKVTHTDEELAFVIGHEIGHVSARHGNERMSHTGLITAAGLGLGLGIKDQDKETQAMVLAAYGLATQVGAALPFSRLHESEADELGLLYMARAGYDPRRAIGIWGKMAAASGSGGGPPEWLSTHPAHTTRTSRMEAYLPRAMDEYQRATGR